MGFSKEVANLRTSTTFVFLGALLYGIQGPCYFDHTRFLGLTQTDTGYLLALLSLSYTLVALPVGMLADHLSDRLPALLSLCMCGNMISGLGLTIFLGTQLVGNLLAKEQFSGKQLYETRNSEYRSSQFTARTWPFEVTGCLLIGAGGATTLVSSFPAMKLSNKLEGDVLKLDSLVVLFNLAIQMAYISGPLVSVVFGVCLDSESFFFPCALNLLIQVGFVAKIMAIKPKEINSSRGGQLYEATTC